jgi:hypothetical protein
MCTGRYYFEIFNKSVRTLKQKGTLPLLLQGAIKFNKNFLLFGFVALISPSSCIKFAYMGEYDLPYESRLPLINTFSALINP